MELTEVDQKIFFLVRETLQKVITDRNDKPITTFSDKYNCIIPHIYIAFCMQSTWTN